MSVIDLNEIYKIIFYMYILSFKKLEISGVKHSHQPFMTMDQKSRV